MILKTIKKLVNNHRDYLMLRYTLYNPLIMIKAQSEKMKFNTLDSMNLILLELNRYCGLTGSSPPISVTEGPASLFLELVKTSSNITALQVVYNYEGKDGSKNGFVLENSLDSIFLQMNGRMCSADDVKVLGILVRKINIKIKQEIVKKQNEINEFNSYFEG